MARGFIAKLAEGHRAFPAVLDLTWRPAMIVIMVISFHDVEGLADSPLYRQVSVATGSRHVAIAGQVATDAMGRVVGPGDLATQTEQCYLNAATALASVGATFDDVTRLTVYFTDWSDELAGEFVDGIARAAAQLGSTSLSRAPLTGVVVAALAAPEFMIEVEATAVLD